MKKKFFMMLSVAIAAIVFIHIVKLTVFQCSSTSMAGFSSPGQSFSGHGFQNGGFGHFGGSSGYMMEGQRRFQMGYTAHSSLLFPFLFYFGLAGVGFTLYKQAAKKAIVKGIGTGFLFIGLWGVLPNWIVLLGLIVGAYYWYKSNKSTNTSMNMAESYNTLSTQKLDFLDEWERSINNKEEK